MKENLRICFVCLSFSPSVGGAQVRAEKQARQLQALGHEVVIVTARLDRRWGKTTTLNGLPVVRVGGLYRHDGSLRLGRLGAWPISLGVFLVLWRLRRHYDVIHAFQITPLAAVAALIGALVRKPVIISSQSSGQTERHPTRLKPEVMLMADTLTDTSFLKIDLSRVWVGAGDIDNLLQHIPGGRAILQFLRSSNAIYQVLSTRSRSYLVSWRFRPERIVYIPGSVDVEKFRPAPERRPAQAGVERDIICVARLEYSKGIDVLLHAWKRMMLTAAERPAHLKPRLRLVGEGTLRPQLERIVAELNIQDSVEFLGLRADVVDLLQRSWGFVLPSRGEGMPNALLEAMACGLPCVATRVSGSEDVIADGNNGLLVEPEQPAEMAGALRRLVEDAELAHRLGREGRATVVREYQLIHIVEQCLGLYRRLLDTGENEWPEASPGDGVLPWRIL
jgi:glycosyltransferase involved in cell wall biosynthesis